MPCFICSSRGPNNPAAKKQRLKRTKLLIILFELYAAAQSSGACVISSRPAARHPQPPSSARLPSWASSYSQAMLHAKCRSRPAARAPHPHSSATEPGLVSLSSPGVLNSKDVGSPLSKRGLLRRHWMLRPGRLGAFVFLWFCRSRVRPTLLLLFLLLWHTRLGSGRLFHILRYLDLLNLIRALTGYSGIRKIGTYLGRWTDHATNVPSGHICVLPAGSACGPGRI